MRQVAVLLVVTLAMSAGRLLACELGCPTESANAQASACHEAPSSGPLLTNDDQHACEHATTTPAIAAQKINVLAKGATHLIDLLPRVWTTVAPVSPVHDETPPPPPPAPLAERARILRI